MRSIILGSALRARTFAAIAVLASACALAGCGGIATSIPAAEQPLSKETMSMLGRKGMDSASPMFVRIFKEESELEVWKARDDGRFYHYKTYPICNWSGNVGPKTALGDKQAPEGFYRVSNTQMNPNSNYYLAFNLGYPNAYDRAWQRTGDALMVHGKCKSVGCYAMTDALIEEIYTLARESLKGGQESFEVHAFPFRMTEANMARYQGNENVPFWKTLKQGYDFFEKYRLPPTVAVCEKRYVVNVKMPTNGSFTADGRCPRFQRPVFEPFTPKPYEQQIAEERIVAPGPKTRQFANMTPVPTPEGAPTQAAYAPSYGLGAPVETGSTGESSLGFAQ
ncbi:MAG: murein L,D-transpeptidase family protein [Hyphomicrobium sp.]|jgi:murein L,D-transpeptidase YafK